MKIYAFTDVHSNLKITDRAIENAKKNKADLIIVTGDLTFFNQDLEKILGRMKCDIPIIALHGNHEDENEMRKICKKLGIIFLHKATFEVDGYLFVGYGNDGFAREEPNLEEFIKKVKVGNKKVITLTHGPPYGTKLDYIQHIGHVGCKSINKMIEKFRPEIHLCGHIHESFGLKQKIGNTILINPGPLGILITLK